ncbi:alpha/beta fold hydrolase [Mycobacterium sp. WMMD1722]|uniref:alpha/beta fold hydrolase n=1 Tax=Mycobacterium sp. WMMD1722 TaxID=3404117 RepID=UPI003BF606F9
MTVVFVHGNPETSAIWGPLVSALNRDDVVLLTPPGFGAHLPSGFGATYRDYRDWLEVELEAIDGPIDLVGHDWGGGHVVNVVMHRPELARSWVCDVLGIFNADFKWHGLAQEWQTPGKGEESVQAMFDRDLAARTEQMISLGFPDHDIAAAIAEHQNADMGRAILAVYRSATQPAMAEAGSQLEHAGTRPGLALLPTEDSFNEAKDTRQAAVRAGARIEELEGLGHWWMVQDPQRSADALNRFWAGVR